MKLYRKEDNMQVSQCLLRLRQKPRQSVSALPGPAFLSRGYSPDIISQLHTT